MYQEVLSGFILTIIVGNIIEWDPPDFTKTHIPRGIVWIYPVGNTIEWDPPDFY